MNLLGLPPGVDAVRFGQLELSEEPTEFVLGDDGSLFTEGCGLIVQMLPDWTAEWDMERRRYTAVEHFEPREVVIQVTNSTSLREVEVAKAKVDADTAKTSPVKPAEPKEEPIELEVQEKA